MVIVGLTKIETDLYCAHLHNIYTPMHVFTYVCTYVCILLYCLIVDKKILYVAYDSGDGYVNKVFDLKLGYMYRYAMDGSYIYAAQVRNAIASIL